MFDPLNYLLKIKLSLKHLFPLTVFKIYESLELVT